MVDLWVGHLADTIPRLNAKSPIRANSGRSSRPVRRPESRRCCSRTRCLEELYFISLAHVPCTPLQTSAIPMSTNKAHDCAEPAARPAQSSGCGADENTVEFNNPHRPVGRDGEHARKREAPLAHPGDDVEEVRHPLIDRYHREFDLYARDPF